MTSGVFLYCAEPEHKIPAASGGVGDQKLSASHCSYVQRSHFDAIYRQQKVNSELISTDGC